TPTNSFATQVRTVRAELASVGRDPRTFPIAKRIYIAVDDDATRARERMNAQLALLYGRRSEPIEVAAATGTVADCVGQIQAVIDAGAELILFTPLFDQADLAELIASKIIPQLG